jgi:AcrR family transcriptional regulator
MGRPRRHDAHTAEALLDAAERIVQADGVDALSVRRVADAVSTTTRAVYSLFGSKDGLVAALGTRTFQLLGAAIEVFPATDEPAADLVEAGVRVFRRIVVLDHPSLFLVGVQQTQTPPHVRRMFRPVAQQALGGLEARVARLERAGLLGERPLQHALVEFHALCEGLAALELRGLLPAGGEETLWRDALTALVAGFAAPRARGAAN